MFWSHCHEQLNSTNCSYSSNSCIQCSFVVLDPSNSCNSSTPYHSHCDRPRGPLPSLHAAWPGAQAFCKYRHHPNQLKRNENNNHKNERLKLYESSKVYTKQSWKLLMAFPIFLNYIYLYIHKNTAINKSS